MSYSPNKCLLHNTTLSLAPFRGKPDFRDGNQIRLDFLVNFVLISSINPDFEGRSRHFRTLCRPFAAKQTSQLQLTLTPLITGAGVGKSASCGLVRFGLFDFAKTGLGKYFKFCCLYFTSKLTNCVILCLAAAYRF